MIKSTIKFTLAFLAIAVIPLSVYLQGYIQSYFPGFRADLFIAMVVLIGGIGFAILLKNLYIGVFAFVVGLMMPTLLKWFLTYLPYA